MAKKVDLDTLLSTDLSNISVIKSIHADLLQKKSQQDEKVLERFLENEDHFFNVIDKSKSIHKIKQEMSRNLMKYRKLSNSEKLSDDKHVLIDDEKVEELAQLLSDTKDVEFYLTKTRYFVMECDCQIEFIKNETKNCKLVFSNDLLFVIEPINERKQFNKTVNNEKNKYFVLKYAVPYTGLKIEQNNPTSISLTTDKSQFTVSASPETIESILTNHSENVKDERETKKFYKSYFNMKTNRPQNNPNFVIRTKEDFSTILNDKSHKNSQEEARNHKILTNYLNQRLSHHLKEIDFLSVPLHDKILRIQKMFEEFVSEQVALLMGKTKTSDSDENASSNSAVSQENQIESREGRPERQVSTKRVPLPSFIPILLHGQLSQIIAFLKPKLFYKRRSITDLNILLKILENILRPTLLGTKCDFTYLLIEIEEEKQEFERKRLETAKDAINKILFEDEISQ